MGRASALLSRRTAAFAVLAGALVAYYAAVASAGDIPTWWDIALGAFVLIPGVFALVYLVLPLRRARGLLLLGVAFLVLTAVLETADLEEAASFAKLAAMTTLGFWFLGFFETVGWVVLVAAIIPLVDAASVWRGPTREIVTDRPEVFGVLSFGFPLPGGDGLKLGAPDLLFFAVFLAAAVRFGLRPGWTWLAMSLSFGATMALAVWLDPFGLGGVPALPLLSLAFLAANADLLWRALRPRPASVEEKPS